MVAPIQAEIDLFFKYGVGRMESVPIRTAVRKILTQIVEPEFWTAPASPSGRHHPKWQNGVSGLVRHTTEMLVISTRLASAFGNLQTPSPAHHLDMIYAAICLHDAFKGGRPWQVKTSRDHAEISSNIWNQVAEVEGVPDFQREIVREAILFHEGRWSTIQMSQRPSIHQLVVHLADMVSSHNDLGLIYEPVALAQTGLGLPVESLV